MTSKLKRPISFDALSPLLQVKAPSGDPAKIAKLGDEEADREGAVERPSIRALAWGLMGLTLIVSCDSAVPLPNPRTPGAPVEQTVAAARRSTVNEPLFVSMIQLIARPSDFDGEFVRVVGFYRHEFEGNSLYLHQEDYEQGLTKNGLWMDGKPEHNMTYILVEGRFSSNRTGHLGMWSGEIGGVTRIVPWLSRDQTTKTLGERH